MELDHAGTKFSFSAKLIRGRRIEIEFRDGKTSIIHINEDSPVEIFFPSIEGDVIVCITENNPIFFDTATGNKLSQKEVRRRKSTFYSDLLSLSEGKS